MPDTHQVVWTPEKITATWDFFSEYRTRASCYFSAHAGRWIVKEVARDVPLRGKRILDYGCGRGDLIGHLIAAGYTVQGYDVSHESVETTTARFAGDTRFAGATADPAELPDGAYDVVFLVEVIEHLLDEQIPPVLADVHRLLAPDGVVVVTAPNAEELSESSVRCPDCGAVFHEFQHMRSLDPASIAALFEQHGFRTRLARGAYWGLTVYAKLRTFLRSGWHLPKPHLLYVAGR